MWTIRAAVATDDGANFIDRHFGDAEYFDIYDFVGRESRFVKRVTNTVDAVENVHADPVKAGGIMGLLLKEGVNTVISRTFGLNIKRIREKFVCIRIVSGTIQECFPRIDMNFDRIRAEWEKGEERRHLTLADEE